MFATSVAVALAALPLDSRISVALTAPWATSDPAVEAAELIRQAHSHDTLLQFWKAFAKSSSVLEAVEAVLPPLAARALGALLAARAEAPRVAMWAQLAESLRRSHAVDESAPCWYVACGAPVASADAAMSKLRDGESAAHGTGPGCAAAGIEACKKVIQLAPSRTAKGRDKVAANRKAIADFEKMLSQFGGTASPRPGNSTASSTKVSSHCSRSSASCAASSGSSAGSRPTTAKCDATRRGFWTAPSSVMPSRDAAG